MKVVILIPTYNERENIIKFLKELDAVTRKIKKHNFKILIVDDMSPDGTGDLVDEFVAKGKLEKKIYLLSHRKEGLGRAMIRGYLYAIEKFSPEVVVTTEADFAYDLDKHLLDMLDKIESGYDLAIGSRHVKYGRTEGWTYTRRINHWIANTLFARIIAGESIVHDHNGALRAIKVKGVLDKIGFKKMDVHGFAFFFYSLHKILQVTHNVYEFPVTYRFRVAGESKVSFNKKYIKFYLQDILEYIKLSVRARLEK